MISANATRGDFSSKAYVIENNSPGPCHWSSYDIYYDDQANTGWYNGINDRYPAENAVGEWNSVNGNFQLMPSSNYNIYIESVNDPNSGWTGITYLPACTNGYWSSTATIELNDGYFILYNYNFAQREMVTAHELGHALGLGHENNNLFNLMYYTDDRYCNGFTCTHTIAPLRDDINGIISIYGLNLDHAFTSATYVNGYANWPGPNGYPVNIGVNSGQQGWAMANDPNVNSFPGSNVVILPEIVSGNTYYRSAIGAWAPLFSNPALHTLRPSNNDEQYH